MDRNAFGKKTRSSQQRPRVDRFVAPRDSLERLRQRQYIVAGCQRTSSTWYGKYVKQQKYVSHIEKAFGLEARLPPERQEQSWPCVPRARSFLSSADNILDLPTYSARIFPELLDWSHDNTLVAALGTKYYKWSWDFQSPIGSGFTLFSTACCRFDPSGERLALGTTMQRVEIHNAWSKMVAGGWCRCVLERQFCNVTAVDWSPTGNSFATGCSQGKITCFDRDAKVINFRQAITIGTIFLVKVSPDARYVAAAALNSAQVLVFLWPSLAEYSAIGSDWLIKTIAWHPWRSALLGIGGVTESNSWIALWDAPRATIRDTTAVSNNDFNLDVMLFSHRTGELVLSLWNTSERQPAHPNTSSQLVVLSGPDTVVDQWGEGRHGMDRVRTMVFSPDGTKLATATADEDLIIMNFLPEDKKKAERTMQRRFSAMPSYIDHSMQGFSIR